MKLKWIESNRRTNVESVWSEGLRSEVSTLRQPRRTKTHLATLQSFTARESSSCGRNRDARNKLSVRLDLVYRGLSRLTSAVAVLFEAQESNEREREREREREGGSFTQGSPGCSGESAVMDVYTRRSARFVRNLLEDRSAKDQTTRGVMDPRWSRWIEMAFAGGNEDN